jgi:predicted TIM-barrel fold metal-dependent hydrolase
VSPLNDAHAHFFSPRFFATLAVQKGLVTDDPAAAVTALVDWESPASVAALADRWRAELDRHHVARTALIASVPGDEASVAEAVARHPTRFVGYFMVDPTASDAEARVRETLTHPGMRVVCLFPAMQRYPLDDPRVARVVAATAVVPGTALFVHCGVLSVGVRRKLGLPSRFEIRYGNPLDVQRLAIDFPTLPIIIPHFGAGFFREALMAVDACSNVYFDTSSSNGWIRYHPGLTLADVFRQALAAAGPDRLLFGTDSSFFPRGWQRGIHEQQRAAVEALGVDTSVTARVFGLNFDRLFPLGA